MNCESQLPDEVVAALAALPSLRHDLRGDIGNMTYTPFDVKRVLNEHRRLVAPLTVTDRDGDCALNETGEAVVASMRAACRV